MTPLGSRSRLAVAFVLTAVLIAMAQTPAAAICLPPGEVAGPAEASASHRYVWFLIESLAHARQGWQEADEAGDSQHPVVMLADLKLAVEDFQCATSLVETFRSASGPDELTTTALRASAVAATGAYTMFAGGFQQWATALSRGETLALEAAADFRVRNEKAGEYLIHAAEAAGFALMKPGPDSKAWTFRLTLTRAQRAALREGLKRRNFRAAPNPNSPNTHAPDWAAALLYKLLTDPRYKASDQP